MTRPTVIISDTGRVVVTKALGIAGQVAFTLTYSDRSKALVVGSSYGMPGPVTLLMQGWVSQQPVTDPARFGPKFDEQWVENFVLDREVTRETTEEVSDEGDREGAAAEEQQ